MHSVFPLRKAIASFQLKFWAITIILFSGFTIVGTGAADDIPQNIDAQMQSAMAELNLDAQTSEQPTLGLKNEPSGKKSIKRAMLFSLILPGAGEYYLGYKNTAYAFWGVEAATWSVYAGYKSIAGWRRDDLNAFTRKHAGIDVSGRDDDFLQILKRYPRSENLPNLSGSYNEGVRRDARILYPNDPSQQEQYEQENYLTGDDAFTWDTQDNWTQYKVLLHEHRDANKKAFLATGVAMLNRIVSVIDTIWLGKRYNKMQLSKNVGLELETDPIGDKTRLVLNYRY